MSQILVCEAKNSIAVMLKKAKAALAAAPNLTFNEPALEARLLLEHASNKSHTWLITHDDKPLSDTQVDTFNAYLAARISGQPIGYIIGTQDFWTLRLKVAPCTLIPRQDTEILVESVLKLPLAQQAKVLDLGTGTGAIALALASEKPEWQLLGLDKIDEAVALAKENAKLNNISATFIQSNWFESIDLDDKFDLIVSNPPYVEQDSEYLNQGDLRFEPSTALSSGVDGLDDIRIIIDKAKQYMHPQGWIAFEHGCNQAQQISAYLAANGFINITTHKDYNQLDRVTLGQLG